MFRELIKLFSKESLIDQAYSDVIEMLRDDREMYIEAIRSLRHSDTAELTIDFRERDKKINKLERRVRKKVLTHLTVQQGMNATAALVIASIVIDVERVGDYCKNFADLALIHPTRLDLGGFEKEYVAVETTITSRFDRTIKALEDYDSELGSQVLSEHAGISRFCDEMKVRLVKGEIPNLPPGEYASLALYTRYLKRIAAHLSNIASSVVNPFHRIGFKPKDM
jgi:phosphate uptake regulator